MIPAGLTIPRWVYVAGLLLATHAGAYLLGAANERADLATAAVKESAQHGVKVASAVQTRGDQVRRQEASGAAEQSSAVSDYHRKTLNDLREKDRTIADLRAGTVRLRDQLAARAAEQPLPAPGGSACRSDGQQPGDLHPATAAALFELARDADAVAAQLALCQRTVIIQQQTCNGG